MDWAGSVGKVVGGDSDLLVSLFGGDGPGCATESNECSLDVPVKFTKSRAR